MGAMTSADCMDYLNQGFTTCRDAGGNVLGIAKAIKVGRIPGPRMYVLLSARTTLVHRPVSTHPPVMNLFSPPLYSYACGAFISQTGGHGDTGCAFDQPGAMDMLEEVGFSHICDSVGEVRKAVRNNLRNGATQIKFMAGGGCASEFDPLHIVEGSFDEMKTACEVADDYGTYVMIHAYHDKSINRALDAGVRCVEHGFL